MSATPSALLTPRLRSSLPAVDIPGFFDCVEQAMALYIKSVGMPDGTSPTLVHEFPKERLGIPDDPFDVITYKIHKSTMAPTMNSGAAPRRPKLREVKQHPNLYGFNLRIEGWWELVQPQFIIWSKSSRHADTIAAWFHQFMVSFAFVYKFFEARGVTNFRFVERSDDDMDLSQGQEVYKRRLTYEMRLESLLFAEEKQLTDLTINASTADPNTGEVETFEIVDVPISTPTS